MSPKSKKVTKAGLYNTYLRKKPDTRVSGDLYAFFRAVRIQNITAETIEKTSVIIPPIVKTIILFMSHIGDWKKILNFLIPISEANHIA